MPRGKVVCADCHLLVDAPERHCSAHKPKASSHGWTNDTQRMRGRRLQAARMALFADEPFCRMCQVRLGTIRDHIRPLAEGGSDEPSNIQPLCADCSATKTQAEAQRGRRGGG